MITLKELEIGDKFYPASKALKRTAMYRVLGAPEFNIRHGSPTRKCVNLCTNEIESKSCRLKVIKN